MTRRNWLWTTLLALPLAVAGGLVFANSQKAGGYTCPLTGEQLACERCCPLNGAATQAQDKGTFICPATGEQLPCEKCCPLNNQ